MKEEKESLQANKAARKKKKNEGRKEKIIVKNQVGNI